MNGSALRAAKPAAKRVESGSSLALFIRLAVLAASGAVQETPSVCAADSADQASMARSVKVLDLAEKPVAPFDTKDAKALVFFFISVDCPISNHYAPEMRRFDSEFSKQGVRFWMVYPDVATSAAAIRRHQEDFRLPARVVRDPSHQLVRCAKARVTPEVAVFLPGGTLVYHGRIDNRYVALGQERPKATRHDLREVLEAVVHDRPSPARTAPAVGCYIADPT